MIELDDIVGDFLVESKEGLDLLDRDLVALEERPKDRELLGRIFRSVHTIKGSCGFLEFCKLERVAHAGESLLARLRDGTLTLTTEITTGLLAMVDAIRVMLARIENTGTDGDDDFAPLVANLGCLLDGTPAAGATKPKAKTKTKNKEPSPTATEAMSDAPISQAAESASSPAPIPAVESDGARSGDTASSANENIRVNVALIDQLMNQVGELVLARNEILQFAQRQDDTAHAATTQRLNLITSEIQAGVMRMRMQPIDSVLSKFPRLVRDVSKSVDKRIRLDLDGRGTELDKTLLEAIKDPLTHLLRNSIDHGVEKPEERVARGKPEEGRILIRAYHESARVIIEISDDGGGIPVDRIKAKAIERELITKSDADRLTERQLLELIFLPGLSTAEKVTNVSGRGVGMDVVKTNVEKMGGQIEIQSRLGVGTTFRIQIPLTLAIVPALIIACDTLRYAIPQANLVEVMRVDGGESADRVENLGGAPVFRLRGQLLPLVDLSRFLDPEAAAKSTEQSTNIVVLQCEGRRFGLVVDSVIDSQEIVVKPLGSQIKGISAYSGATILGDGQIALILDVPGLGQQARAVAERSERHAANEGEGGQADQAELHPFLLVRQQDDSRLLIPLECVARLERLAGTSVESVGETRVAQYRGEILPLVDVADLLPVTRSGSLRDDDGADSSKRALNVVVIRSQAGQIGLVIAEILDVVEQSLVNQRTATRAGVSGSMIVDGRVTELLDLDWVLERTAMLPRAGEAT